METKKHKKKVYLMKVKPEHVLIFQVPNSIFHRAEVRIVDAERYLAGKKYGIHSSNKVTLSVGHQLIRCRYEAEPESCPQTGLHYNRIFWLNPTQFAKLQKALIRRQK